MACVYVGSYGNSAETQTQQRREMDNIIPTEFMTETLNGVLATNRPPNLITWDVPLPELLLFVEKVTSKARIDYNTAMVALVLLSRLKKRLPKNAHGEYGTCHRLFLSAILVASKDSTQNQPYPTPTSSQEKLQLPAAALLIENCDQSSPPDFISSSSSSSSYYDGEEGEDEDSDSQDEESTSDATNCRLAEISDIFSVREVNRMEREFRKLLGGQIFVDETDVKKFMEINKYALGSC